MVVTIIFDIEIILRFIIAFPDWRAFFRKTRSVCDLFLAVSTTIIQIPAIRNSGVYGWLTIFQILRVYRVILAVPITRNLLVRFSF
jgi:voltage-dependent calcium channel